MHAPPRGRGGRAAGCPCGDSGPRASGSCSTSGEFQWADRRQPCSRSLTDNRQNWGQSKSHCDGGRRRSNPYYYPHLRGTNYLLFSIHTLMLIPRIRLFFLGPGPCRVCNGLSRETLPIYWLKTREFGLIHTTLNDEAPAQVSVTLARRDDSGSYAVWRAAVPIKFLDSGKSPGQLTLPAGEYGIVELHALIAAKPGISWQGTRNSAGCPCVKCMTAHRHIQSGARRGGRCRKFAGDRASWSSHAFRTHGQFQCHRHADARSVAAEPSRAQSASFQSAGRTSDGGAGSNYAVRSRRSTNAVKAAVSLGMPLPAWVPDLRSH